MTEKTNLVMNQFVNVNFTICPIQIFGGGFNWKTSVDPDPSYSNIATSCHTGAITSTGQLFLSGANYFGRLGTNTTIRHSSPVQTISSGTNWRTISVDFHTVATKTDGTLWSWGQNTFGNSGDNTTINRSSPVQTVSAGTNWKQSIAGNAQTLATKTDGSLWMWGYGGQGVLGNNDTLRRSSPVQTVSATTDWKVGHVLILHSLGLKTNGTLWSWGRNIQGRLGNNATPSESSPVQVVGAATNWSKISGTASGSIGLKTDGTLWGWGINFRRELGTGADYASKSSPVQTISGGTNWKFAAGNKYSAGGIKTDGTLWVWGNNRNTSTIGVHVIGGESQFPNTVVYQPCQTVLGGTDWSEIAFAKCGGPYSGGWVATKEDGSLWGSGSLVWGEKGNCTYYTRTTEERDLGDILVWKDCFTDSGLFGFGWNDHGQLGINSLGNRSSPVQTISGGSNWKSLGGGGCGFMGAIKNDGTLWMQGRNAFGALGDNTFVSKSSPVQTIAGGTNWKAVCGGGYVSIALKTDGTLWTWGGNTSGFIGTGVAGVTVASPVQTIAGGSDWASVSSAESTAGAIKTDGTLWMWGLNSGGMLADNTIISKCSPVQTVSGGTNWKKVSVGPFSTSAIKTDGTLWTWGFGNDGRLGDLTTFARCSPVQTISGGIDWKQSTIGGGNTHAIKIDGTLWGWGSGEAGRLGNNNTASMSSPVQTISGGSNWKVVDSSATVRHVGAIKTDGTLWMWGGNFDGRLGNQLTGFASSPIQTVAGGSMWKQIKLNCLDTFALREDCW